MSQNNNVSNESGVTIRSRSSSSIADKSTYSDDTESHQSVDTIATEKSKENNQQQQQNDSNHSNDTDFKSSTNGQRKRGLTVTQQTLDNNEQNTEKEFKTEGVLTSGEYASNKDITNDMVDVYDQIQELQRDEDGYSDSESYTDDMMGAHRRHQSHRSTMSSIHSFVSSASNYDLLLARLGSKDSVSALPDTQINEIKTSFERVYSEAVTNGDEEEIDWEFWSKVISDFNGVAKSQPKVLSYHIQRGIPPSLRGMIWQLFAKSKSAKLEEQYMQLIKEESVYEKAIARDLPRVFADNEYFQGSEGQEAFFNVMKAFSLYDKELGYSQEICYIVGPLLLNMPEEETFCVLVQLMNKYGLRGHFLPQTDLIARKLFQLEGLVTDHLPHVQRHFENQGVRANAYAHQWFSTLFVYKFPLDTVFRIFDMIFAEESNYSELSKEHTDIAKELITAKMNIARINDENEVLRQQSIDLKKALETLPVEVEARVKEEMEILYTKNAALVERNSSLEDQLAYMENMIIDIKAKYSESEEEREALRQRLTDLKLLMG
ncbi:RabGAP/TBC [Backusella circina FSU 941]|nr:RabGAP/TBC [Backusella circina FSU 941]